MMATSSRKGRVGQTQYWTFFGIYVVAVLGLVGFALYSFVKGELAAGVIAILPLAPLGLYFRVIEMRRCRDIGWPAFLPWLLFVIPVGIAFTIRLGGFGTDIETAIAALTVPLLVSLIDFAFAIVIGCIATKDPGENYAKIFGGEPQPALPPGRSPPRPDYDQFDEAIARALDARRTAGAVPAPEPAAALVSPHARAVAGFGRKVI